MASAVRKGGRAVAVSALTTVASCYANLVSPIRPIREFGFFTGTCLLAGLLLVLVAFPPLLVLGARPTKRSAENAAVRQHGASVANLLIAVGRAVGRHRAALAAAAAALLALSLGAVHRYFA